MMHILKKDEYPESRQCDARRSSEECRTRVAEFGFLPYCSLALCLGASY